MFLKQKGNTFCTQFTTARTVLHGCTLIPFFICCNGLYFCPGTWASVRELLSPASTLTWWTSLASSTGRLTLLWSTVNYEVALDCFFDFYEVKLCFVLEIDETIMPTTKRHSILVKNTRFWGRNLSMLINTHQNLTFIFNWTWGKPSQKNHLIFDRGQTGGEGEVRGLVVITLTKGLRLFFPCS